MYKVKRHLKKFIEKGLRFNFCLLFVYMLLLPTIGPEKFFSPGLWWFYDKPHLKDGRYVLTKYYDNSIFTENTYIDTEQPRPDEKNVLYSDFSGYSYCFHNVKNYEGYDSDFMATKGERLWFVFLGANKKDLYIVIASFNYEKNLFINFEGNKFVFTREK